MTSNENSNEPNVDLEAIPDAQTPNDDGPSLSDVSGDGRTEAEGDVPAPAPQAEAELDEIPERG